MKIRTMVPYDVDANLGRAYNEEMERLPNGDWAIFQDHDSMPTTGQWFRQIMECVAFMPDAGAFVATTNRIASPWQRAPGVPSNNNDIAWHRKYGAERLKVRTLLDITDTKGWGGVLFAINKEAWKRMGGFADGLGCVDHSAHFKLRALGYRMYLVEGLYQFHWRHFGEPDPTSIFPKAANCPCRGAEIIPTVRIELPC